MANAFYAGRFALVEAIGHGGMGTVWLGYDHRLGRECAVKLIDHAEAGELLRVAREQSVRLSHPHVACPYAWAAEDDQVLIAMDLVRGGSLHTLIRDNGAIPGHYTATILAQLLDALDHIHRAGLLHRDVKPANVLLETTGQGAPHIRLADFGLVFPVAGPRLTLSGHLVGTPGYLPPEALKGAPPDRSRDLYAVGLVGWQLLTGSEEPLSPELWGPAPEGDLAGLWKLLRALSAPHPDHRPPDAVTAARLLALATAALPGGFPALTDAGEPIEVFDLLAPIPEGTGDLTPLLGTPRPAPRAKAWSGDTPTPPPERRGVTRVLPEAPAPPERPPPGPWPGASRRTPPSSLAGAPAGLAGAPAGPERSGRRWVYTAMAGAVLAAGGAWLYLGNGSPEPSAPAESGSRAGADGEADGEAAPVPGPSSPRDTRVSRSPLRGVSVGNPCAWNDVGSIELTTNGIEVRCTYADGVYRWRRVTAP